MAAFFKPSIDAIIEGLRQAFENGGRVADVCCPRSHLVSISLTTACQRIILVGGLASSPYVYSKVSEWGERFGISISSPDGPTTKAVANGALAWHLDSIVSSRIARYHYGVGVHAFHNEKDPEMAHRPAYTDHLTGARMVTNAWSCIVGKVSRCIMKLSNVLPNKRARVKVL